jgi:hypothetical protein
MSDKHPTFTFFGVRRKYLEPQGVERETIETPATICLATQENPELVHTICPSERWPVLYSCQERE